MRNRIRLFSIFGFSVNLDPSWLVLGFLVAWTLAVGYFPTACPHASVAAYWWMGVCGSLGLFLSIVLHELCHSLVARIYGLSIKGITLFIFGGVAEMESESPDPRTEFLMAGAGPMCSFLLAWLFSQISHIPAPLTVSAVFAYLAFMNCALAVFNLVPAFPLDGGRVLRSMLWAWKGDMKWATRITSNMGSGFGMVLIMFGILSVLQGSLVGGIWMALIGTFLRGAASSSYQSLLVQEALSGQPLSRFMRRDVICVPTDISLQRLVEEYFYRYHFEQYPVIDASGVVGLIGIQQIAPIPREQWPRRTVAEALQPLTEDDTIDEEALASRALTTMSQGRKSRLIVVDGRRPVGLITLKDLLRYVTVKLTLPDSPS